MRKYQKEVSDLKSEAKQTCLSSQENPHTTMTSLVRLPVTREAHFCVFAPLRKYQMEVLDWKSEEKTTSVLFQEDKN